MPPNAIMDGVARLGTLASPTHCVMERHSRCARLGAAYGCRFLALVSHLDVTHDVCCAMDNDHLTTVTARSRSPAHGRCAR